MNDAALRAASRGIAPVRHLMSDAAAGDYLAELYEINREEIARAFEARAREEARPRSGEGVA